MNDADQQAIAEAMSRPDTFGHLLSNGTYRRARHLAYAGKRLALAPLGGVRDIYEWPSRHGKSDLIARWTPAWILALWPWMKIIIASHSAKLAIGHGKWIRNTLQHHEPMLGVRLMADSRAADEWYTTEGGGVKCVGVGGGITGFGAHTIIIDDPYGKAEDAYSETIREKVWTWYTDTLRDRTQPGFDESILLMAHRWHEDDLTGRLKQLQPERWHVSTMRALCEEGDEDPIGRAPGEALWPWAYSAEKLVALREEPGQATVFSAKYQQHPRPAEGSVWKGPWFTGKTFTLGVEGILRFSDGYSCPLSSCIVYATTDVAGSKKDQADWTVVMSWAVCTDGRLAVLAVDRWKAEGPETIKRSKDIWKQWGWGVQWVEISGKKEFVDTMRAHGLPIRTIGRAEDDGLTLKGDKVAVAYAATPVAEAGRVWLPQAATWTDTLLAELLAFPLGANDDQCLVGETPVACERGTVALRDVQVGDRVLTRFGYRSVLWSGKTGESRVMSVVTDDGRVLRGTENHPVLVGGRWVPLGRIRLGDRISVCASTSDTVDRRAWSSRGARSADTRTARASHSLATSCPYRMRQVSVRCIERSGRLPTDRYQTDSTSITSTRTRATTTSRTLSASARASTGSGTDARGRIGRLTRSTWSRCASSPPSGMAAMRVASGTASTPAECAGRRSSCPAQDAALTQRRSPSAGGAPTALRLASTRLGEIGTQRHASVRSAVRRSVRGLVRRAPRRAGARVVFVSGLSEQPRPVWNLTVEGEPEFTADGLVVHNCDAFAWGLLIGQNMRSRRPAGKPVKRLDRPAPTDRNLASPW